MCICNCGIRLVSCSCANLHCIGWPIVRNVVNFLLSRLVGKVCKIDNWLDLLARSYLELLSLPVSSNLYIFYKSFCMTGTICMAGTIDYLDWDRL